jgi:hypothetical protein
MPLEILGCREDRNDESLISSMERVTQVTNLGALSATVEAA